MASRCAAPPRTASHQTKAAASRTNGSRGIGENAVSNAIAAFSRRNRPLLSRRWLRGVIRRRGAASISRVRRRKVVTRYTLPKSAPGNGNPRTEQHAQRLARLSPHLTIWKWGPHMLVSILHRATGVALAIGGGILLPGGWQPSPPGPLGLCHFPSLCGAGQSGRRARLRGQRARRSWSVSA